MFKAKIIVLEDGYDDSYFADGRKPLL